MTTMPAVRHCAAGLAAVLVIALVVNFGGHATTSGPRPTTGSTQAGTWVKPGRIPQSLTATDRNQALPDLDLAATPPVDVPDASAILAFAAPHTVAVQPGRDVVTATGRAPPVL
ncbi:hypothetical protein [Aeromicrobium sp.]|uniref:hypothetical protein n=1 Tax=Aeromicrobium sp. TaxID=1871063 RepID=UPI003C56AFF8